MDNYLRILEKYWGHKSFRPLQDKIIRSIMEGNDTLVLMPTGGGKSISFQLPAMVKEGICIVITPLIALMNDQVENLKKNGIKAIAIHSGLSHHEMNVAFDNARFGEYKFLYVSPERIESEIFRTKVSEFDVNFIVVDEAHCISQWGYDFRPSYLRINSLRKLCGDAPVLALTATATPEVVKDIQDKLSFQSENVLSTSFFRENLTYYVRQNEDKYGDILKILKDIKGSSIVYVRNRKKTKEISGFLNQNGFSSDYYHAGLKYEIRIRKQEDWTSGQTQIMVATNAFGMGIDKSNVRYVIHYDLPDSLEAYFQEAGRAGRDGKRSFAILLANSTDKRVARQRITNTFPEIETVKRIYEAVGNYLKVPVGGGKGIAYDFNIVDFASVFRQNIIIAFNSLKLIELEGYIELTDEINNPSRIHFILGREDLYKYQIEHEAYDVFIKLLLRSYTGLFNEYVPVNEEMLAKKSRTSTENVVKYLIKLSKQRVISYIPQKRSPLLIFTEERLDTKSLRFTKENYQDRKSRYTDRLDAMLNYAFSVNKCRSQLLLEYFGEKGSKECGACDVCQNKKEMELKNREYELISEEILSSLKLEAMTIHELVDKIPFGEKKILEMIKILLDEEKLKYTDNNKLECK